MIKQLTKSSISSIATASTLQNLQSFVKELVENSIDALSTSISLQFFNFGRDGFEITDNGVGIQFSQSTKLAVRGGTSKITIYEDLETINTHGFRGEALNAISALSNITITSKHQSDEMGWKWDLTGSPAKCAKEQGTSISVRNIFYSLPVRQKEFEKEYKKQYNKAINNLTEYAIINTSIDIKVWNTENDKPKSLIINSGNQTNLLLDKIRNVLGDSIVQQLVEFKANVDENNSIAGFLSKNIESGSSRGQLKNTMWYCFANKKPINAPKGILKIMTDTYRQYNPKGKFIFILELIIGKASDLDFNVSVDKRDIYLRNEKMILDVLEKIVISTLEMQKEQIKSFTQTTLNQFQLKSEEIQQEQPIKQSQEDNYKLNNNYCTPPQIEPNSQIQQKFQFQQSQQSQSSSQKQENRPLQQQLQQQQSQIPQSNKRRDNCKSEAISITKSTKFQSDFLSQLQRLKGSASDKQNDPEINENRIKEEPRLDEQELQVNFNKKDFKELRVIGQFNQGFIICELEGKLYLLDQHACDEKRNYEMLSNNLKLNRVKLVKPIEFELASYQIDQIKQNRKLLSEFQFEIELDDSRGNTVRLLCIPQYGKYTFGKNTLLEILEQIDSIRILPGMKQILASQACRQSIMIGTVLQRQQMEQLVKEMGNLDSPWNCPHGRPTLIKLEQAKLKIYKNGFSNNI